MSTIEEKPTEQCSDIRQELPDNIEGRIVLSGYYEIEASEGFKLLTDPTYIWIPTTDKKIEFLNYPSQKSDRIYFKVSPNKQNLAYYIRYYDFDDITGELIIVNSEGKKIRKYFMRHWWNFLQWIDDGKIE